LISGFRPRLWPTLISAAIVLVCLGLGIWQLQRLHWKEGLVAARAAAVSAPPIVPPPDAEVARRMEFRHVTDQGVFLHDKEVFVGASAESGTIGYHVLTPLREPSGRIVFVNRGYVPAELKDPGKRAAGELAGPVKVAGLLRLPLDTKPNWFLPDNRPDLNYWFWVDLPAMAKADGLDNVAPFYLDNVAPFYIDADATPNPGGWPRGGVTRLVLPNDHLQYAITWFGLAIAMAVVYVVSQRQQSST
jgi:surfeit locus 1 family protein